MKSYLGPDAWPLYKAWADGDGLAESALADLLEEEGCMSWCWVYSAFSADPPRMVEVAIKGVSLVEMTYGASEYLSVTPHNVSMAQFRLTNICWDSDEERTRLLKMSAAGVCREIKWK